MLLVLMLFLLSQSRGDNPLLKAKNIETGAELASGSDSSPCLNNADPRSLSSITPPPQQPIPLPHPRLKIQPQRIEANVHSAQCPKNTIYKNKSAQRSTSNTEEYRNQIGTVFRIQHRSIQEPDRHSVPHPIPKHTDTSQHPPLIHNQELLKKSPRGVQRGRGFAAPLRFSFFLKKILCAIRQKSKRHTVFKKKYF